MRERFDKLAESVDRLSLRERLFVFAAVIVVLGGLWEALLAAPLDARERRAATELEALQSRLALLNESIATAADGMSDGMPGQLDRLTALRARVAEGDEAVRVYTADLVDPAQMRAVLEDVIRRQVNLRLVSATNLPVRPLFDEADNADGVRPEGLTPGDGDRPQGQTQGSDPSAAASDGTVSAAPKLYRHTLVLRLQGSYLDCLAYLESIERLPWHLYWTRLELDAGEYPRNEILLEVQTLSLEQGWIGV